MPQSCPNLNESRHYADLLSLPFTDLRRLLTAARVSAAEVPMAAGLHYNYAAMPVEERHLDLLQGLSDEFDLVGQYQRLLAGERMNVGENRRVLHHLTRGQLGPAVMHDGRDLGAFYREQHQRIFAFAEQVHRGALRGSSGAAFTQVCQIGIGGSDLGPRALYLALQQEARRQGCQLMTAEFLSNVDPDDADQVLARLDLARTLFVLVSKSGTTQETLTNETLVRAALRQQGLDDRAHLVAVTSETSPLAGNSAYRDSFYMDDFVGGRFSSTSAVGAVVLSLAFGPAIFQALLAGAHAQDALALQPDIRHNASLLDALLGVYLRNVLGYPCSAVLPYSQALSRFPAHLQQLDMESNGKSVNRRGEPLPYASGPIIFGEPGTNGQHSFYQLLHQGTDVVPLQFIGFEQAQGQRDLLVQDSTSQDKLNANLAAQLVAFAKGRADENANRHFAGQRPASLIRGARLTAEALGALLAHFENKIMFQGFVWNINSFDQEGVQLGKVLTGQLLAGTAEDEALQAYGRLLGLRPPA